MASSLRLCACESIERNVVHASSTACGLFLCPVTYMHYVPLLLTLYAACMSSLHVIHNTCINVLCCSADCKATLRAPIVQGLPAVGGIWRQPKLNFTELS